MTYHFKIFLLLMVWSVSGLAEECRVVYLVEGMWVIDDNRWSVEKMPRGIVKRTCAEDWGVDDYGMLVLDEKEAYFVKCFFTGRWHLLNLRPLMDRDVWFFPEYENGIRVRCNDVYVPNE